MIARQRSGREARARVLHDTGVSRSWFFASLFFVAPGVAQAQMGRALEKPPGLEGVDIAQKLGAEVPLDLPLRDENDRTVTLKDYVKDKPVILTLVYYECPMLCTLVLNGTLRSLRALSFDVGREFDVVTLSFDPKETGALASAKKEHYIHEYGRAGAAAGWHFLTGPEPSIKAIAESVGFSYKYDAATGQYAHATAIMVLTPKGLVSHYFYGVEYPVRDFRLALVEAGDEKIGDPVDRILLYCFHYDPTTGKYGLAIMNVVRLLGSVTFVMLAGYVCLMLWRERRRREGRR
jgi:protein SCO1